MAEPENSASFHVAIQKVFQTMKAIVDGKKEQEFLEECLTLETDRYVMVSPKIVTFVKDFLSKHDLPQKLPKNVHEQSQFSAAIAKSLDNGETCF
jgi:hypothetical protein